MFFDNCIETFFDTPSYLADIADQFQIMFLVLITGLLSVWFRYGKIPEICSAIEAGLATVHLDNWLGVLPQLIARIDHPEQNARRVLHDLLGRLGQRHAQALVYPLSVALKSPKGNRKEAAEILMASLRQHSAKLIDQALLVSQELVRVAILWQEVWHECLEEASRQYFGDGNIQAMLDTLVPLHVALKEGPTTLREAAFCQAYATDLHEAFEYISAYKQFMADTNQTIPQSGAAPSAKRSAARTPSRPGASGQVLTHFNCCIILLFYPIVILSFYKYIQGKNFLFLICTDKYIILYVL